ncbi:hypothetical protein WJX72_006602 [[Myrmecia] bisecta]|uniref:ATP-dependent DNA helicase n=1 Tax=[Myrmecia] bisecta TaxID=41462 RepID=A0AAW1PY20_9CHLO
MRELPRGRQLGCKGAVINVPADTARTQVVLPRLLDELDTVALKLKRQLKYKGHYMYESVRPRKVMEALKWLVDHSELWQSLQIATVTRTSSFRMRKGKLRGKSYTAGQMLNEKTRAEAVKGDVGFQDFVCLRGSPQYWEKAKTDVFQMMRQLGSPTFFFTLSMADTRILLPHDEGCAEAAQHESAWEVVKARLKDMGTGTRGLSCEAFLEQLALTEQQYCDAVRCSITRPTVFLKRDPDAIRIDAYNAKALISWRANMDIQFCLDPYAAAVYVVSYMMKGNHGMSRLMEKAAKKAAEQGSDLKQRLRSVGNTFLRAHEISAQEAVYLTMGLPLRDASRSFIYIPTTAKDQRTAVLKKDEELKGLSSKPTDITYRSIIDKYACKPSVVKTTTLAQFAAWYEPIGGTRNWDEDQNDDPGLQDAENEPASVDDRDLSEKRQEETAFDKEQLRAAGLHRRSKAKVIGFRNYREDTEPEESYREQLLLHYPWHGDEDSIIGSCTTFRARDIRHDEGPPACYDLGQDMHTAPTGAANQFEIRHDMADEVAYRDMCRQLNGEQRRYFKHALHWLKRRSEPLHDFLSGGAGVGKSVLVRALVQAAMRWYRKQPGKSPGAVHVLVMAFTGTAAFNVDGNTIHHCVHMPIKKNLDDPHPPSAERLDAFNKALGEVELVVIDEISMVSSKMLAFKDSRLRLLKDPNKPFGGVHVHSRGPVPDGSSGWLPGV